jgi:hypothetical protein
LGKLVRRAGRSSSIFCALARFSHDALHVQHDPQHGPRAQPVQAAVRRAGPGRERLEVRDGVEELQEGRARFRGRRSNFGGRALVEVTGFGEQEGVGAALYWGAGAGSGQEEK